MRSLSGIRTCAAIKKSVCASAARTLRPLLQAQPAQRAAVAADAGGAAAAGVQGDGPDHQRQRDRQIQAARNVHVHLWRRQEVEKQPSCLCTHRLMECQIKKIQLLLNAPNMRLTLSKTRNI